MIRRVIPPLVVEVSTAATIDDDRLKVKNGPLVRDRDPGIARTDRTADVGRRPCIRIRARIANAADDSSRCQQTDNGGAHRFSPPTALPSVGTQVPSRDSGDRACRARDRGRLSCVPLLPRATSRLWRPVVGSFRPAGQ